MHFYIIELNQQVLGNEPNAFGNVQGFLAEDHTLSTIPEDAQHFETIEQAAATLAACDYDGCMLISATIERVDIFEE